MVIIKMKGGLGNQISQYAFSRLLAKQYPQQVVKIDTSWFDLNPIHNGFELDRVFEEKFLQMERATDAQIFCARHQIPLHDRKKGVVAAKAVNRLIREGYQIAGKTFEYVQEIASGYPKDSWWPKADREITKGKNGYFNGYWHSYDYLQLLPQLRKELVFRTENISVQNLILLEEIRATESVSVHIRKGDYKSSMYDITTPAYYKRAVQLLESQLKNKLQYFVFSDSPEEANEIFSALQIPYNLVDVNQGMQSYLDMYLMKNCRHNIITNSTFSYWAAMLNDNAEKRVVRPKMQTAKRKAWKVEGWDILDN